MAEKQQSNSTTNWIVIFTKTAEENNPVNTEFFVVKNTPFRDVDGWALNKTEAEEFKQYQIFSTDMLKIPERTINGIKVTYELK